MSFIYNEIYKKIVSEEIEPQSCTKEDISKEFVMLPKSEAIEETLVVGEEIVVDDNMSVKPEASTSKIKQESIYFGEEMDHNSSLEEQYTEASDSMSDHNIGKQNWLSDEADKTTEVLIKTDTDSGLEAADISSDDQNADEETIATFLTAAGQQLALYAVEDSEEIFAVAVYDESGEPPTNFQFLMKADVERLIGEGAVRTVKKPTQIKKQLLTTQPSLFFSKAETMHEMSLNNMNKIMAPNVHKLEDTESLWDENPSMVQHADTKVKEIPDMICAASNKESENLTYVMMEDNGSVHIEQSHEHEEETESDCEFMEQSTVQYILFEGDQSDSELTFDEIEATLQSMKAHERQLPRKTFKKISRDQKSYSTGKQMQHEHSLHKSYRILNHAADVAAHEKFMADRQELLDTLSDPLPNSNPADEKQDFPNGSAGHILPETTQVQLKTKRSRKQQLISVNREDSEIIIQPAMLMNEEAKPARKTGKRRKKVVSHSGYHRSSGSKRIKRKRKEVEIIEIDVDEDENVSQSRKDVVEITIDDNKDKYSSDKENEIIMVGDSDEESQQSDVKTTVLQCQHCSRTFRQQRALETHLRVCSKSPTNIMKFAEQKLKNVGRTNSVVKKEYACKICQEKFDVVVALARHVRSAHSQRKKRRLSKSPEESVPEPDPEMETESEKEKETDEIEMKKELENEKGEDEESNVLGSRRKRSSTEAERSKVKMINRVKTKRKGQRSNRSWEVKKLSCTDCGRWFPSTALLRAHYLQHETKNTEQRIRRCQVCKKLIKSRLLYKRHLKMHSNAQQGTIPVTSMQKKLHTTRSVTRRITSVRKRGRPRKL